MSATTTEARRHALTDPLERYRRMVEIREVEDQIFELFAAGTIHGTTHLAQGQEALAVGLASVTEPTDAFTATYRGHAIALALGVTPRSLLAEVMGKAEGSVGGVGGSMHMSERDVGLLPTFAIVGAGLPVAAGAALAFQIQQKPNIAVAVFGDGATNIGAFHESLNLAAIWKLPVLFVIDNNVYGEYSRWDVTTPIEDLYKRAASYAMPATKFDGMDVDTVRESLQEAVEYVRGGNGPMLVEAKTYRFAGHSRSDTAPYRPSGELEEWKKRDPILLAHRNLIEASIASTEELAAIEDSTKRAVGADIEAATAAEPADYTSMFRNIWNISNPA